MQTYSDGTESAWIEPTVSGQAEPERPAPVLTLAGADDAAATAEEHDHGAVAQVEGPEDRYAGLDPPDPHQRPSVTLTGPDGQPYDFGTETTGAPTLLFFGYTDCRGTRPTTVADVAVALRGVDPALAERVQVGPGRDRPRAAGSGRAAGRGRRPPVLLAVAAVRRRRPGPRRLRCSWWPFEVVNATTTELAVPAYSDEPHLRIGPDGVWRNANGPATYIDLDRSVRVTLPAHADPAAEPDWAQVSTEPSFVWPDHRTHWMSEELLPPRWPPTRPASTSCRRGWCR